MVHCRTCDNDLPADAFGTVNNMPRYQCKACNRDAAAASRLRKAAKIAAAAAAAATPSPPVEEPAAEPAAEPAEEPMIEEPSEDEAALDSEFRQILWDFDFYGYVNDLFCDR